MAGRFGGRGRGRGFRGFAQQQEPFVEFPDLALPDSKRAKKERDSDAGKDLEICLPDPKKVKIEESLASCYAKLLRFGKDSCYHLEDGTVKSESSMTVERYTDRGKKKTVATRDSIHQIILNRPDNFPRVLATKDLKIKRGNLKKVRWDPRSDQHKFDLLEHLEEKDQKKEEKGDDKEVEEEEEEEQGDAREEDSSDDDYQQNEDFDDDDDDFNQASDEEDFEQMMD